MEKDLTKEDRIKIMQWFQPHMYEINTRIQKQHNLTNQTAFRFIYSKMSDRVEILYSEYGNIYSSLRLEDFTDEGILKRSFILRQLRGALIRFKNFSLKDAKSLQDGATDQFNDLVLSCQQHESDFDECDYGYQTESLCDMAHMYDKYYEEIETEKSTRTQMIIAIKYGAEYLGIKNSSEYELFSIFYVNQEVLERHIENHAQPLEKINFMHMLPDVIGSRGGRN